MLTSEVAVLKSCHGISVNSSRYRDTGTTDPSLVEAHILRNWLFSYVYRLLWDFTRLLKL